MHVCHSLSLCNSSSFAVFGLDGQLVPDVAEDLADLSLAGPVLDALLQDMVNALVALRSQAAPSLILQFGPADNLRVLLCVGIVKVIPRSTILPLGKLIFRYLCDIVHELVSPSRPHVIILGFAKFLMLRIVPSDRSQALSAVLSALLNFTRKSLYHVY